MGHSYGTFVLSRIVQMHKPIVQSMVCIWLSLAVFLSVYGIRTRKC